MIHIFSTREELTVVTGALALDDKNTYSVLDNLGDGPLVDESMSYDILRKTHAVSIQNLKPEDDAYDDVSRLMKVSSILSNFEDRKVTIWIAPNAQSMLTYYFVLHYLRKHSDRLNVINIGGLPFIDGQGKLFFPKNITELSAKEIEKCLKLSRKITPSEIEVDIDEWKKITEQNTVLRQLDGTKRIISIAEESYYDPLIQSLIKDNTKPSRLANTIIQKHGVACSVGFIVSRINAVIGDKATVDITPENGDDTISQ